MSYVSFERKCIKLRQILEGDSATLALEAHNGLSAKIVEEVGFPCIWASGLSISASLGLRDCNEASWSQVLDVVEYINDSVSIPVLFDGDSGFGNFNNVRHIVKKLSNIGIAGISLEDKLFPKMNSFVGNGQALATIDEFVGKIRAARDVSRDDNFSIIARTEALIAGSGVEEALRRAECYVEAGANAIFIHSKQSTAEEILEFSSSWNRRCPLVVAPTTYSGVSLSTLEGAGVRLYICANHLVRASMKSMQKVAKQIMNENSIAHINKSVSSLSSLFELLEYDELEKAEKNYNLSSAI